MLRGSTDFLKTGTPYCTDQFCMDQRFKNILQKRNSVGSADIALTALLDHIITEPVCGQENLCTHCGRSSQALIFKVESSHLANIFEVIQEILPLIVNCGLDHICNQKAKNV